MRKAKKICRKCGKAILKEGTCFKVSKYKLVLDGFMNLYNIVLCFSCGLVYLNKLFTDIDKMEKDYIDKRLTQIKNKYGD